MNLTWLKYGHNQYCSPVNACLADGLSTSIKLSPAVCHAPTFLTVATWTRALPKETPAFTLKCVLPMWEFSHTLTPQTDAGTCSRPSRPQGAGSTFSLSQADMSRAGPLSHTRNAKAPMRPTACCFAPGIGYILGIPGCILRTY